MRIRLLRYQNNLESRVENISAICLLAFETRMLGCTNCRIYGFGIGANDSIACVLKLYESGPSGRFLGRFRERKFF